MTVPNWSPLARHRPVHELSREDAGRPSSAEFQRRADGLKSTNQLTPSEAVAAVQAIRGQALRKDLPDSTPLIRADRDGR